MRRSPLPLVVLAAGLVLASCGGSDSSVATAPVDAQGQPVDVKALMTQLFAELTSPALTGPTAYGMAVTTSGIGSLDGCTYTASAQSFVCPDITTGGLTLTKSFTLRDGSGALQSSYNPTTTATVRISSTLAGPIAPGGRLVTDSKQQLELSGLRSGTHVVDGTANAVVTGIVDPVTSLPVIHHFSTSISELALPSSSSASGAPQWPKSGSIATQDSVTMQGAAPVLSSFELRFSGTSRVSVLIVQASSTKRCSMDLASLPLLCN